MSKTYLVKFKPLEPYYFGNEKNFLFPKAENNSSKIQYLTSYYIKGELMPSQSTILGVLRYMFLPVKKANWDYTEDEKKINDMTVGYKGFEPTEPNPCFGKIERISPIILVDNSDNEIMVPLPYDHHKKGEDKKEEYKPFSEYKEVVSISGTKYYSEEYDSKNVTPRGYLKLNKNIVVYEDAIFKNETRVGINRTQSERGFFKKQYSILDENYSFGVYVTLEDELVPEETIVFMGQGKSAFVVSYVESINNIKEIMQKYLNENIVYCLSDCFVDSSIYDDCFFAMTKVKTYRSYSKNGKRVTKGGKLYRLVTAGSIFIPRDKAEFLSKVKSDSLNKTGYNVFVSK